MSSYCRITGKTRGLPTRTHYVPLLPPISAKDAKKLARCSVTRGAQAMPYPHHFIPVVLVQRKRRATLAVNTQGRIDLGSRASTQPVVQQGLAEVWPPPDFEKRRAAREAALQKVDEARGGRSIAAERRAASRIAEERPPDWNEDVMLGRALPEESSAVAPSLPEEMEKKRGGGLPTEEENAPLQAATAEEMEVATPPEMEVMPHKVLSEYRYVIPIIEGEESKPLKEIISNEEGKAKEMEAQEGGPDSKYVYVVDQYMCGIVLNPNLESAVRGGAVEEVMVSPNLEKVALRLRRPGIKPGSKLTGENVVTVPAKIMTHEEVSSMTLLEGAGPEEIKWSSLEESGELALSGEGIVMRETTISGTEEGASGEAGGVALVPGQVMETSGGPRFVPGQIVVMEGQDVEKDSEKVHFIPGEVVETNEGPKFVVPDLVTSPDGKMAFSVQGFAFEDVSGEKQMEESPQSPRPELQRRLSLKLEGLVEEIAGGDKNGEPPRRSSIVQAIVSEDEIKSAESGPEAMEVDTQDVSRKRRKEEDEEENQGQAMLGHLSKRLQTQDTRESGDGTQKAYIPSQGDESRVLSSEELELRVDEMRRLATEAAAIGASLGLPPADAAALLEALSHPETAKALASDPVSVRLLRGGVKALRKQRRREMRRESRKSSGLISLTEDIAEDEDDDDDMDDESEVDIPMAIRSSRDIPRTIFKKLQDPDLGDATLEMFTTKILAGLQTMSESPVPRPGSPASVALVILKDNLQAVIPREASRRLLTGNAPFTIIDETGIRRFKPTSIGETPQGANGKPVYEAMADFPQRAVAENAQEQVKKQGVSPPSGPPSRELSQAVTGKEPGAKGEAQKPSAAKEVAGEQGKEQIAESLQSGGPQGVSVQQVMGGKALTPDLGVTGTQVSQVDVPMGTPQAPGIQVSEKVESQTKVRSSQGKRGSGTRDIGSKSSRDFPSMTSVAELDSKALKARWVARVSYMPGEDDPEGLALEEGDVVELVPEEEADSSAKRARLGVQTTETFFSSTTSTTVVEGSSAVTSTSTTSTTTLLDNSAARHKIAIRPKRKHADPRQKGTGVAATTSSTTVEEADDRVLVRKVGEGETKQGWVPTTVLTAQDGTGLESGLSLSVVVAASQQEEMMDVDSEEVESADEAAFRREAVIRELVETEEEFGKDLKYVVEKYLKPLEDHHGGGLITPSSSSASVASSAGSTSSIPRLVRDHKDIIFGNFSLISEFHNGVLIEGFKYYANEPKMLGRTFLRLERDFDKHVAYCRDEPQAQAFLDENEAVREYFEEYSQQIGDDKSLPEHLKLPIQRINDYQLLLKELVKYSVRLGEDATDLQRALELMLGVPHRSGDLKFISSIEGYRGNIHKLGRLLKHDWFSIEEGEGGGKTKERYLFLFKGKILVCKVRRIQDDRSVFNLKEILKLPELELKDIPEDSKAFHLRRSSKVEAVKGDFEANFPLLVKARSDEVKADWLTEIRQHAKEVFDTKEVSQVDSKVVTSETVAETKKVETESPPKKVESVAAPEESAKPAKAPQPVTPPESKKEAPSEPKKEVSPEPKKEVPPETKKEVPPEPKVPQPVPPPEPKKEEPPEPKKEVPPEPKVPQPVLSPEPKKEEPPEPKKEEPPEPKKEVPPEPKVPEPVPPPEPKKEAPSESKKEVPPEPKKEVPPEPKVPEPVPPPEPKAEVPAATPSTPKKPEGPEEVPAKPQKLETPAAAEAPAPPENLTPTVPPAAAPTPPSTPSTPSPAVPAPAAPVPDSIPPESTPAAAPSAAAPAPVKIPEPTPEPVKESQDPSAGVKRKEPEAEGTTEKKQESPPKKLATEDTESPVSVDQKPEEMDQSLMMSRKSSRSSKVVEEYQSISTSYAASTQEEVYMETSSSSSARRSMQSSSVRFQSDGITSSENDALRIEEVPSSPRLTMGGSDGYDKKPVFSRTIEGFSCEPGETATFECEIESSATVTWLKDNRNIDDKLADRIKMVNLDRKHSLEILHCRESDTGLYTALATNENGVNSSTAQLVVQELTPEERKRRLEDKAPIFLVRLKDTNLLENTYLRFMVKVKGNPNPEVKFYKDGREIRSENMEERVHVVREHGKKKGFYELVITDVQQSDAGKYSCNAFNEYGDATCEAEVTVTDEKTIFAGLGDETDFASGKTTFTWLRDGQPFDPEERFKVLFKDEEDSLALVFQHVKPEDAGLYTCVAQTSSGKISCSAELTVKGAVQQLMKEPEKPKITTEIKTTEVNVGGSAMLELKASGYPKPEVKWYKENGEEVTAGGRYRFLYEDEESIALVIKGVTVEDAGKYKIVAKNEIGEDVSHIDLSVKSPPKIISQVTDMTCKVQETLEMTIEVEGTPAPDVKWYKDGQTVSASATVKIGSKKGSTSQSMSHSLTLTSSKLEDAGSYSVVATNDLSQSSIFWKLTVTSPPKFLRTPTPETIIGEGESVTLEARVEGYPTPKVKWLKDQMEVIPDGKKIKVNDEGIIHTITLVGSSRDDAGLYTCVATNEHGSEEASGRIRVRCPPKFNLGLPKEAKANEGDVDVEFVVNVEAFPKPNIKWYLDEVEITEKKTEYTRIEEGDNFKLVIREVKTEMSGKYSCKIFNDLGSSESSCTFSVMCKPRFPKGLNDKVIDEGDSLTLTIECYANPEPEVKWYKDNEEIKVDTRIHIKREGSDKYNLTFDIVKKSDSGEYEVRAKNNMGEVNTRSTLNVNFAPEIISSNMTDSSIHESLSKVFEVKATGLPRPEVKWFKDGEELKPSKRIIMSDSGEDYKLEVKDLLMPDDGDYKCVVSNRLGEKSLQAKLHLICVNEFRKPKVTCAMKDVKVKKGEEAVLRATIVADPVPDITWYHDEKKVEGEEIKAEAQMEEGPKEVGDGLKECTFTLRVPNGEHFDSGVYRIHAKNKFGEGDCSARLDILLVPEIEAMKDVTTIPYENVTFKVVIYANPVAKVVWTKDGEKLKEDKHVKIIEDLIKEEYSVELTDIGLAQDGVYTVTATNDQGESSQTVTLKVHTEPPNFVKNLEPQIVKAYHDADFRVRVNGVPKPQMKWFKDGVELKTEGRITIDTDVEHQTSSLVIEHMEESDEAMYLVRASNVVGDAETYSKLTMAQIAPSFARPLDRSAEVDEGDLLELKVKVEGSPIPTVKWFKDGEELVPSDHVKLVAQPDGNVKLTIDKVVPTDCGAYKLVVTNKNGEKASICAVAVKPNPRKPSFSKELEDAKLVVGQPLKLEVQVMAFPAPEVKWFKDGHPVRPSQAVNFVNQPGGIIGLHMDAVRLEDAGQYTVTVANRLGEISGKAEVQVEAREKKPYFQSFLQPVSVVEGFPAKLEIKVLGHPKPTLKWTHNGKEIVPDGERIRINEMPDGTVCLLLDKTQPGDAGEYAVIASNEKGDTTSKAKLDVAGKDRDAPEEPPSFVHDLRDVSTDEGSPLILEAPFLGNPIPDVKWTKDGAPVTPSDRNMLTCDGKRVGLQVKPACLDDAGNYECTLTNPLGSATSSAKAAVRKIYQAPKFTQTFGNLQQLPTFDAKFPVKVTGFPTPEISWYKNGVPINAAKNPEKYKIRRDGDTCCLFVRECVPDDAGTYSCKASNLDGEATCEAKLEVVEKIEKGPKGEAPSFLKKIGDCEVCKGMTAKFTACATGYPEPEFEWLHNGDRIFPSDRIKAEREGSGLLRLSIANVHPSDVGQYGLRIYNNHGEDKCEAQLTYDTLESKPKRPIGDQYVDYDKFRRTGLPLPLADRPIISRMTDRRLTLSWKPYIAIGPTDLRGPPVTYRLEMCEMPDGDWFTVRSGIRSCACDVSNLEPFRDYKFRVRVENKYGISDPSPFAITYREKLEPDPPKFFPYLEPGIDFRPETSPYFPKDFDIEKPPHDGYSQAPRFLRQEHDAQYGVKGHNCHLFWFVYGYPKPKMTYYYNDEPIEMGGRYDSSYTRNGQATLFINRMLERDVGWYEAVARNEHGEARQRVRLEIAEFPKFITRPEEIVVLLRRSGRLEARVTGVPYPDIKWYKDWQPLAASSRIRMIFHPPDTCILSMGDVINRDEGLYSISARNVAGSVSASAMIHVEEDEREYGVRTYGRHGMGRPEIKARPGDGPKGFNELYDIGDELGRGTQGITYHAVERLTGRNYAAKIMHGKGDMRPFMYNELEILNLLNHRKILRLHEAFETKLNLTFILELASGGEFFDILSKQSYYTESDIAGYVRQILWALEHMHEHSIAHLGLNPGDILFSHPGGDEIKICDFGLARRISTGKLASLNYGVPEFVAPEVANGDGVSFSADMWSLGIIIYILLSGGTSLFRGKNDKETLERIKSLYESKDSFLSSMPDYLSTEARDFITKLLLVNTERRMDVRAALSHPWLIRADRMFQDEYQISTSGLRTYLSGFRDWYSNASCRKWFRRRPLEGAYTHPSRMVYPPGMQETPPDTPRVSVDRTPKEVHTWDSMLPPREPLDYETGNPTSESHYQYGPDTYLLQLRDVNFPVRLREYMKVAANRSPGYSLTIADRSYDWRTPIIRERRRFTDVMDEEIDDERKSRIDRYSSSRDGLDGLPDSLLNEAPTGAPTPRRLRRELGTRLDAHAEAEAYMEAKKEGQLPFFREKPQILPIREQHPAELVCLAVGDPKPLVQWFKNDLVITENNRVKILEDADGRSILRLDPALSFDVGIYKVVARNKIGQTVARTRMVLATTPGAPDSPESTDASDTEILLKWKQPRDDGNSPILCYSLQYKEADELDWIELASNIDHEFYLIGGLKPTTSYHFRLAACNRIGWSHKGIPTELVKTKEEGAPKVQISRAMRHLQQMTESGAKIDMEDAKHHMDYSIENNPPEWSDGAVSDKFTLISEINRGRFSSVVKALDKSTDKVVAAKIFEWKQAPPTGSSDGTIANGIPKEDGAQGSESGEAAVEREFKVLRTLRHERIAFLESAWHGGGIAAFIMEKLQGADILTFLSSRHEYTEQMVATIITQVLDGLQYLHWRGYCHLDIQPDNIVMASVRSVQIKLVDFGSAQRVTRLGSCVRQVGHPEYSAPEIQSEDPVAFPQSDIWSVGVITYVLLSGESPFKGSTPEETHQNVSFVRFRFEYLFKELTQEATRFIMLVFKKAPSKRPLAEECHEHRWLLPTEFMIKKRERAVFFGNRLKEFTDKYHTERQAQATKLSQSVTNALSAGGRGALLRSSSIQEELTAAT
ncbi:protein Obscurin isoform X2 [Hetaerina americana]|uniref:protein Obscurin isoform X2 n=1 Tax=Hetaerina americana TaxID=62018 RepID=UPI003A7F3FD2